MKISVTQTVSKASSSPNLLGKLMFAAFFLLLTVVYAQAQNITVRGRVLNDTGRGIPNASVTVKGTTTGVPTSSEGDFEISAPSNGTLVISSVGFTSQQVSIGGRANISIVLQPGAGSDLEQVVADSDVRR